MSTPLRITELAMPSLASAYMPSMAAWKRPGWGLRLREMMMARTTMMAVASHR